MLDNSMKFCENCGNEIVKDNATFCGKCGSRVGVLKCKNCGETLSKDEVFCTNCGQRVDENKAEEKAVISKKVPSNNSDNGKTKKLIFWIISIFVVSLSLLFVLISIFSNWIGYSNIVINEYTHTVINYSIYDELIESFSTITNKNTDITNSVA
ncbi:MAG: zinc-ribbon domain-containing protein, partial [Acholeplasmatales bacterium]|nr:zinc-ribbon domain-containing protein [Acholeplasmatales bacterium]